jgi:hypothetical protein
MKGFTFQPKRFHKSRVPGLKRAHKYLSGTAFCLSMAALPRLRIASIQASKINDRIQEIRDAGYEVFLVIEAKIGFSRKGKGETAVAASDEPVRLRITHDDAKFLKSLKISVDET